ncbi:porin family protein [Rapidithrix thailandica]|uniref:Porin family protein n=1 Tax=Rapidithrix thailandica TaxID=413964 RepID=A0AAW9S331_9BACT
MQMYYSLSKKKLVLLSFFCWGLCLSGMAQVTFGLKGGINASKLDIDGKLAEHQLGLNLGMFVNIQRSYLFSIQPEFNYKTIASKNQRTLLSQPGKVATVKTNLQYINIPLLAKLSLGDRGIVVHLYGGPGLDFLLKGTEKVSNEREEVTDHFKSANFLLTAGVGLEVDNIIIDFRYEKGLTDITKSGGEINTQTIGLGVALILAR